MTLAGLFRKEEGKLSRIRVQNNREVEGERGSKKGESFIIGTSKFGAILGRELGISEEREGL